jgi:hypothetical protein
MFAVDRTVMKTPIKLWEKGSEKHYYSKTYNNRRFTHSLFDLVTTCEFSFCFIIILRFFHKIQISTNYKNIILQFFVISVTLAITCTILICYFH